MRIFNKANINVLIFVAAIMLLGCTDYPTSSDTTIQLNPYGITESDLISAQVSLALAESEQQFLLRLGSPLSNPYGYTIEDVQFADSMLSLAYEYRNIWSNVDNNIWAFWPPSQEQIDDGVSYWEQVKTVIESADLPYWESQKDSAQVSDNQLWQEFCDTMLELQSLRLLLADAMLADLAADREVLNGSSSGSGVRSRKTELFTQEINYYSHLTSALELGTQLEFPNWSGLENVIVDTLHAIEGISYWSAQETKIIDSIIPYWQDELMPAGQAENEHWVEFVEHMIRNSQAKCDLITATLLDLRSDSALCVGLVVEQLECIALRKQNLAARRVAYSTDLVDVLVEGASLGILMKESQATQSVISAAVFVRDLGATRAF